MAESGEKKTENPEQETSKSQNHGKLILDATCAPGDIKYPTDIEILNDARIQTILDFRFWILDYNNLIPTVLAVAHREETVKKEKEQV